MAQDIRRIFEARASINHFGSDRMSENMAGDSRRDEDASMRKRLPNHPPDGTFGQRTKRGTTAQKDFAAFTLRTPGLQIGHDGPTDVVWQR
jgi:hypothetical protein